MEIEEKFAILAPLNPEYLNELDLSPYELGAPRDEQHRDELLDTASRAITGTHNALRVRHSDESTVLTFKGPNRGSGGLHEREEIEVSLPDSAGFDVARWPEAIAGRVAPLAGAAPLAPLIVVDVHRRTWPVERDGKRIAELALDEGTIAASGRATPLRELELELKDDGSQTDLQAIRQRLQQAALPLRPESRSKLERGLALLAAAGRLDGHTPLGAWGRHVVLRYLRRMRQTEPAARSHDPDGVHDMRVAIRRLRTTLMILESAPVFDSERLSAFRRRLKRTARALGAVRDADVLLDRLDAFGEAHRAQAKDLDFVRSELVKRRDAARTALGDRLTRPKLAHLLASIDDFARECVEVQPGEPCVEVRHFAGSALWRRYEDVLAFETVMPEAAPPTLHRLRIACKRLRYTIELFRPQLGDDADLLHDQLVKAQDHLGDLQDTVVALGILSELKQRHRNRPGLGQYADALAADCDRLRSKVAPIWAGLADDAFRQRLASLLARL